MEISNLGKVLLLVLGVALLVYLVRGNYDDAPVEKYETVAQTTVPPTQTTVRPTQTTVPPTQRPNTTNSPISRSNDNQDNANVINLPNKSVSESDNKQLKESSYSKGDRSAKSDSLDSFFTGNSPQDANENSDFSPVLDGQDDYSNYVSDGNSEKMTDKDKFNAGSLLPKESSNDYFDDPYESTGIKSAHLLNRPVGVNTIQTTLKNPSLDLRGAPPNPKYPVSPWMNSSYEPDTNIRNQSLCY